MRGELFFKGGKIMDRQQLQELYLEEGYYWGKEPNDLAKYILELSL